MKKMIVLGSIALSLLIGVTIFMVKRKQNVRDMNGQPQQTAEEILQERSRQAIAKANTPLGIAFNKRDWAEFEKLYHPQNEFNDLGHVIRACFISNCFKDFSPSDLEKVVSIAVETVGQMRPQDFSKAGIFLSQVERLPTPKHDSKNYQAIEAWYQNEKADPIQQRLAVLKLGIQDASPKASWVQIVSKGILGNTYGVSRSTWMEMIGAMRNVNERKVVLNQVLRDFWKIEKTAQPAALLVLAQNPQVSPKIKEVFFKFLASKNLEEFEGALKSILPIYEEKIFNEHEITKIKDRLHSFPDSLRTPYVNAKTEELLNILK